MVTVKFAKKELPVEYAPSADAQQYDFQVPRPIWPSSPGAVVKSPDRTSPTTLDRYMMQLYTTDRQHQLRKPALNQGGSGNLEWTPPGWEEHAHVETQTQLQLLELQNKTRLEMKDQTSSGGPIRGSDWKPPPGWEESLSPDYQQALKHLRETGKTSLTMPRQEETQMASINPQPTVSIVAGSDADQAEYHRQLMLAGLEMDAMVACAPTFTPESTPGGREQSVDSVWSSQFTPESTPGFQEGAGNGVKVEPESSLGPLSDFRSSDSLQKSCQDEYLELLEEENRVAEEQLKRNPLRIESQFTAMRAAHTLFEYKAWLADLKQQQDIRKQHQETPSILPPHGTLWREDYQIQLKYLEQYTKQKLMLARQQQDSLPSCSARSATKPSSETERQYQATPSVSTLLGMQWTPEYLRKTQLMHLEQQNKTRLLARQWQDSQPTPHGTHLTPNYQRQLMLLEQQNKERLMLARQEQDAWAACISRSKFQDEHTGPTCVAGGSRAEISHGRPLVIRERPTCDD